MDDERHALKTPETHPEHSTVGHYFKSGDWSGKFGGGPLFYWCDSYDPRIGFWMTRVDEHGEVIEGEGANRVNVSERAIGRTYHEIYSFEFGPDGPKGPPSNFNRADYEGMTYP